MGSGSVKYFDHQVSIYWHDLIGLGLVELLIAGSEIYTFGITSTSGQIIKRTMKRYLKFSLFPSLSKLIVSSA